MTLSIIIPCYNCENTLEEAVDSIYAQKLDMFFEVVMVDDGSSDNTRELIKDLSGKYKEIKYIFHKKNKGGGAARNTAVINSNANVIFCLDADDILGDDCLYNMYRTLIDNELDGVSISKSIKFMDDDIDNVIYITNMGYINENIPFESLFSGKSDCGLYSTFMHTRRAFEIIGGYPENHGFDTQSFAFSFLANGLNAMASDKAIYYHRLSSKNDSYYNREQYNGRVNFNWYKILEEYLYLFNDYTKDKILNFDVYGSIGNGNILNSLNNKDKFQKEYRNFLINNSKSEYYNYLKDKLSFNKYEYYWMYSYENDINLKRGHLINAICKGVNFSYQYKSLLEMIESSNGDSIDVINASLEKNFIKQTLLNKVRNRINGFLLYLK
jgi:glycosyltransferase involved in cell wall biosynthesis